MADHIIRFELEGRSFEVVTEDRASAWELVDFLTVRPEVTGVRLEVSWTEMRPGYVGDRGE